MTQDYFKKVALQQQPKLGVSACLLGLMVRWDGRHKADRYIRKVLAKHFRLVPICPEKECGLGIPREPIRLEGHPDRPRLVAMQSRTDLTARMQAWIRRSLDELERSALNGFIFKSKSPSCGLKSAKVFDGNTVHGFCPGLFAAAFTQRFPQIPVAEENDFGDPVAKAVFFENLARPARIR